MTQPTPTPWVISKRSHYCIAEPLETENLATCWGNRNLKRARANARLIVRAVNSHDAIVEALEMVIENLNSFTGDIDFGQRLSQESVAKSRAALALAKGGTP